MQRDFVSMAIDVLYITQAHCFVALILLLRKHTLRGMELKLSPAVEDVCHSSCIWRAHAFSLSSRTTFKRIVNLKVETWKTYSSWWFLSHFLMIIQLCTWLFSNSVSLSLKSCHFCFMSAASPTEREKKRMEKSLRAAQFLVIPSAVRWIRINFSWHETCSDFRVINFFHPNPSREKCPRNSKT